MTSLELRDDATMPVDPEQISLTFKSSKSQQTGRLG